MTLTRFVAKSAFRNKRRSLLTVASIAFSLLLLCIMLCVWRSFYIDKGAPDSALRIMTRHKVSLANFIPIYYRDKIRTVPGVVHVVPMTWFGGKYKDDKPENFFAQFATDPDEYFDVAADKVMPPDQLAAWKRDRAGCVVDVDLARKHNWKIGDHIILQGSIFPTNPDLTLRGIYTIDPPNSALYFHTKYLEESVSWFKGAPAFSLPASILPKTCQERRMPSTICSTALRFPPRARANRRSSSISSTLWAASKYSSSAFAEPLSSPRCWSAPTPWPCRSANAPAKSPSSAR